MEEPEIIVCAGPPLCLLEGDCAVEAQKGGCPNCRRIICNLDGTETEYQVKTN